jgi:endonuclease/exonuclease/phosphatase family metal-dependent hydrolase
LKIIKSERKCSFRVESKEFKYHSDGKFLYQRLQLTTFDQKTFFVYNTHLVGDPKKKNIQTSCSIQLLDDLHKLNHPTIVCGDFNATYMDEAYLNFEKIMKSSQPIIFRDLKNSNNLREPPFTFKTDSICKTCDYIWFNDQLQLTGGIQHFYEKFDAPIPDKYHSSDHLPITASFSFKVHKTIKT